MGGLFSREPETSREISTIASSFAYPATNYFRSGVQSGGGRTEPTHTVPRVRQNQPYSDIDYTYASAFHRYPRNSNSVVQCCESLYDQWYFPRCSLVSSPDGEIYQCFPMDTYSVEYNEIRQMISNKHFKIITIQKIVNPYLKKSYELKKLQKQKLFPSLEDKKLFHGTKSDNVDNICKNNFNWRLHGTGTGHKTKFGQGVSFSCNAMYASNYCSSDSKVKIMFVAQVLIGEKCLGHEDTVTPPMGFDTSLKNITDEIVVVKFEDNEFYPAYKIMFYISEGYVPLNRRGLNNYRKNMH